MNNDLSLTFNAVRQFVVAPDRYYRVELRGRNLRFIKTGSQFDLEHTGSLGRHQMDDVKPKSSSTLQIHGQKIQPSRTQLILSGIGTILLSSLLIIISTLSGWFVFYFFLLLAFGFVLLMAGLVTPSKSQAARNPHNFGLPLSQIRTATLYLPQKKNQVARLHIQMKTNKVVKLTIKTHADFELVRNSFIPILGAKGKIA